MTSPVPLVKMPAAEQAVNALKSLGRVFVAAAIAAYLATGKTPTHLGIDDLKLVADAGVGAVLLTIVNFLRAGETRFGLGAVKAAPDQSTSS